MTVSVIIPTYQRRELVGRAVASVLAQSYRDFELIVIDDGSTDGTKEALAPLTGRLRYRWQPNRGAAAARNAGLALARGSIVAFLDSDNHWLPDHLAVATEVLERFPEAVLVSTSPRHVLGGKASPRDAYLLDLLPALFFSNPLGYLSSVAVRRDALLAVGGFDERLVVGEVADLWMRLGLRGPFALLERRTFVKEYTRGLKEWGRLRGHFLDAHEHTYRRAVAELRATPGQRARELVANGEGGLRFLAAMRALGAHDERAAGRALREACRLLPELSREAELVEIRLGKLPLAHEPAERLYHLATAAALWPDPDADTPLFLRLCAILTALRHGWIGEARRQLGAWPLRPIPGFTRRALPGLARRTRRAVDVYLHREAANRRRTRR